MKNSVLEKYNLPKNPIVSGFGSLLDLTGSMWTDRVLSIYNKSTKQTLSEDWNNVRNDLKKSFDK